MSLLFDSGGHEGGGSMLLGVSDISGGGQLVRTRCTCHPKIPPARELAVLCELPDRPARGLHDRSRRSHAADHGWCPRCGGYLHLG